MKSSQKIPTLDSTTVEAWSLPNQTYRWNGLLASVHGIVLQDGPIVELDAICQSGQTLSTIDKLNAELATLVVARALSIGITEKAWKAKLVSRDKAPQLVHVDLPRISQQYLLLQLSSRRTAGQFMPTQCIAYVLSLGRF